jgi:hypothetical protein
MNQVELWEKIKARAEADTGTGGLFKVGDELVSGIYNTLAPPEVVTEEDPYIVFSVASASQDDAFDLDVITYTFRFSVFSPVSVGLAIPGAIIDRLYGNGVASSGNLATYGFHRWLPSLTGGWTASVCHRIDQDTNHSEDVYQFVETFRVTCSKA